MYDFYSVRRQLFYQTILLRFFESNLESCQCIEEVTCDTFVVVFLIVGKNLGKFTTNNGFIIFLYVVTQLKIIVNTGNFHRILMLHFLLVFLEIDKFPKQSGYSFKTIYRHFKFCKLYCFRLVLFG